MSTLAPLQSRRFRSEHEDEWRRLERLLLRLENGSISGLSEAEIIALPALYRSTLSSLSIARAISLDRALIHYLEGLAARAYFAVYGIRQNPWRMIVHFFVVDWPAAAKGLWREIVAAALILVASAAIGFVMVANDPSYFDAFLGAAQAQGRNPAASAAVLKEALHHGGANDPLAAFASFLFTHNAQIALTAFALGVLACAPTALLVAQNGLGLGALAAIYAAKGLSVDLWAWLLIHGVTELSAVVLAAAAGFRLGWTLVFPGRLSRLDALRLEARTAAVAMTGVVIMLLAAGLLEGFGRQLIQSVAGRYSVAALTALGWGAYLFGPLGRRR